MKNSGTGKGINRREFMKWAALGLSAPLILPKSVFGAKDGTWRVWREAGKPWEANGSRPSIGTFFNEDILTTKRIER